MLKNSDRTTIVASRVGRACAETVGMLRRFQRLLVLCFTIIALATPAAAQAEEANWWESLQSFGSRNFTPREREPERQRRPEELHDLRPDATPWRSDVIIQATSDAIMRFEELARQGGWPRVPAGRLLRLGEDDERVPMLRKRLRASGDLRTRPSSYESYTFDADLEDAVRRFQISHGLRESGRVDHATFAALNVTAEERLAQLKLNLARLRELTRTPPEERYILVNVPAFQLEAVERYEVKLRHRVIVGRVGRETPSVKATIRALNFFPYWRVPDSVARLDLIPRLQKEPDYLEKEKIRVFDGYNGPEINPVNVDWSLADPTKLKFRQDPGPQNALGLVRLDMSNEFGVYMHDTPMKNLFNQRGRAFSAGCVRVQEVFTLAEWIAKYEPGWEQPGHAQDILNGGQAVDVNLTRPVPVYFTYITAWAEANGEVQFRPDLYGRDGVKDLAGEHDPNEPPAPAAVSLAP
jgi:murein L,D-transpeptidase YcbB/YkuD